MQTVLQANNQTKPMNQQFQRSRSPDEWEKQQKCFNCDKVGHIAKNCRAPRRDRRYSEDPQYQRYPQNPGNQYRPPPNRTYYQEEAYYQPQPYQQTQPNFQYPHYQVNHFQHQQIPQQPRPPPNYPPQYHQNLFHSEQTSTEEYITARVWTRIHKNPIHAVVDSGADRSVITTPLARKLGLKVTLDKDEEGGRKPRMVVTVDGKERKVFGIIKNIPLQIQDKKVTTDAMLIESDRDNILLGVDWIMKYQANLLFTEKKLEFGENGRRYRIPMEITKGVPKIHFIETPHHEPHEYEAFMTEIPTSNYETQTIKTKGPNFVMVILYDHKGIRLSKRIDWDKPMYNM